MANLRRNRRVVTVVVAAVVPLMVTSVLVPFRGSFVNTAAALVMVAVIVALAIVGPRAAGLTASLSSALWFDFFLTPPYERPTISHRPDIETMISIFVVGVMITELAARARHHSRVSTEESHFVDMIRELADLAGGPAPSSTLIEQASASLVELLSLRDCRFDRVLGHPPLARILSDGVVDHVGLHWPVDQIGIPGPECEIVAQWRGRQLGRFVLTPMAGVPISLERRVVAVTMTRIVAATLDDVRRALT